MKPCLLLLCTAAAVVAVPWGVCQAEFDIWHSPLDLVTGDPIMTLMPSGAQGQYIRATRTLGCENGQVALGLTLPSDVVIEGITVCYAIDDSDAHISGFVLSTMNEPPYLSLLHYDPIHLTEVGEHCYRTDVNSAPVAGTITLTIELDYLNPAYAISIGAIAVHVSYPGSAVEHQGETGPEESIVLRSNHPNPFRAPTAIEYALERGGEVDLEVCDVSGRLIRTLFRGVADAGDHRYVWDGRDQEGREMPSGTYFYRVRQGKQVAARGMVLVR
jgi:hypothetical protein